MKIPYPTFLFEKQLWEKGYEYVIGIDEVGKGAFAGPVVAAAVIFAKNFSCNDPLFASIHDSKLLLPLKRLQLAPFLHKQCLVYAIAEVSVETINEKGIGRATIEAMLAGIQQLLLKKPRLKEKLHALVDGLPVPLVEKKLGIPQTAIIKGDQKSISIAAASIIAKVYRDERMQTLHQQYPAYGFFENKGYGTKTHRQAIKQFGLTSLHRTSFKLEKFLL